MVHSTPTILRLPLLRILCHIPRHSLAHPCCDGFRRVPAKLCLDLGRINGITPIMPRTVFDKTHQTTELLCGFCGQVGQYPTNHIDQVQILAAMTTTNIVHLTDPAATEHSVEGCTMIFDI